MVPKVATTPGMVEEDEAPGPVKVDDLPIKWYQNCGFVFACRDLNHTMTFRLFNSLQWFIQRSIKVSLGIFIGAYRRL